MNERTVIPIRFATVAILHLPLTYWLVQLLHGSEHRHVYFPYTFRYDLTLPQVAVSVCCLTLLFRVLSRGDWVERILASVLCVLPALILAVALAECVRLFLYAYGYG
jgi:uncharacterized membrane protein